MKHVRRHHQLPADRQLLGTGPGQRGGQALPDSPGYRTGDNPLIGPDIILSCSSLATARDTITSAPCPSSNTSAEDCSSSLLIIKDLLVTKSVFWPDNVMKVTCYQDS